MKNKIVEWLANGQTGCSSKAMAFCVMDITFNDKSHPYDPSDFNRCLLLIDQVPEIKNHFDKIAKISTQWKKIISNWDHIEKSFLNEVGLDWSKAMAAPKTYALMKEVLA